ncbi:transcriptional regulator [Ignatzschineria indica]|uniref:IclR family transcriptional regulator n=1 Tax=Ignatzschineria indica TaxID=472583 RepID=A0A2U2AJ73_9GAMM|nr:IclR family transcriptional regulator [Ignatzschineria indica]PWD82635.1 IclR family transcriptional regulator [Ignatzschineria indica]GGZ85476.1 transcriptional regulator [Ignatzschineria indica]
MNNKIIDFASQGKTKDRQFVTALARGLEILRCFGKAGPILGNQDLATMTKLPKPTVSRLTHTLVQLGYLKNAPGTNQLQLDIGVLALGQRLLNNLAIKNIADPYMRNLAEYSKSAVAIAARDRLQMLYLHVVHGESNSTMRRPIGSTLPIHSSAMGRACLAAMQDEERNFILQHLKDKHSREEWNVINENLEQAFQDYKEFGCCFSIGEWHSNVNAVAVPLIHQDDIFVFNCGGPNFQLNEQFLRQDVAPRLINMIINIQESM